MIPLDVKPGVPDAVDYYNHKGFYGLQLMAIVDNRRRFRFALLCFPGAAHDSRTWGYSSVSLLDCGSQMTRLDLPGVLRIPQIHNNPEAHYDRGQYLIGDSAFVAGDHMVPPYKRNRHDVNLTRERHTFNQALASARVVVEHTFGMLKMRFQSLQCLRTQINTQLDLERALNWIRACLLVHNFLGSDNDDDFWEDHHMARLERQWEQEARETEQLWNDYTEGVNGLRPVGND